ncbi:MAG: zinc-ribbon domain-containing protein [Lentisphaeria bacterium]|nr:zinc-ribbon domain-containing protein [Lentisphaeria bacterium]
MANVKIHCPNCHQEYDVDEADLGHEAECEACKKTFILQADVVSSEPPTSQKKEAESDGDINVSENDKEKLANLYTLARREFKIGNYKEAIWYYKKIMMDDPDNWEPFFVMSFIKAGHGTQKWENIADEIDTFSKELDETIRLIEKTTDANERNDLLSDMVLPSSLEVCNAQMDGMKQILDSIKQLNTWNQENHEILIKNSNSIMLVYEKVADVYRKYFPHDQATFLDIWKMICENVPSEEIHHRVASKIKRLEPNYVVPPVKEVPAVRNPNVRLLIIAVSVIAGLACLGILIAWICMKH